ncbi:MAG: NAD(P)-dependent oxidoreductase [Caldilinea sp. CFX5]|nr:NAD(P)-dependent oxidoreductase [Caldilinea sp. CFX5]
MTTENLQVGFIGLGAMGLGMAKSLLRAGLAVKGYDINPNAVTQFVTAGGQGVTTVAEAASGADVLVIVVLNADQVTDVLFGKGAAAATLTPDSVVMVCSTVSPTFAKQTAAKLAERDLLMLDTPISGGTARAAEGKLSIMVSGAEEVIAKAQPVLAAMAANIYRMGTEPGLGSTMKLVNQILAGSQIALAAEAMAFGVRAGLDPHQIYEVICNSAGNSFMFQNRVPHMLNDDYTPHSAVDIWVKDLGIVLETGKELRFPLFFAALAHQLFMSASASGHGRLDDAAVVKVFEQLTGISVSGK